MITIQNQSYRVVVLVPAGQAKYCKILARYLEHEKDVLQELDEVRWCLNTNDPDDAEWIKALPLRRPDLHWVVHAGNPATRDDLIRMIAVYQDREGRDPKTLYVRIDHDIVYLTLGIVGRLARAAYQNSIDNKLMAFPYILNAPHGTKPPPDQYVAEALHAQFLDAESDDYLTSLPAEDMHSGLFSANCMAWLGSRLPSLEQSTQKNWKMHEEHELTNVWIATTGRPHTSVPNCGVAVHFSFHGQREYLDSTDLLNRYYDLCRTVTGLDPK